MDQLPGDAGLVAAATSSRYFAEQPTSSSSPTYRWRIRLDKWLSTESLYVTVPMLTSAGSPAPPYFGGVAGLITNARCSIGGGELQQQVRFGHRVSLLKALSRPASKMSADAGLDGSGGQESMIYAATDYNPLAADPYANHTMNMNSSEDAATPYARMAAIVSDNSSAGIVSPYSARWLDDGGFATSCTASATTTAAGMVPLRTIFPELGLISVLPRWGDYMEVELTFDLSACSTTSIAGAGTDTWAVGDVRVCGMYLELPDDMGKKINAAFAKGVVIPHLAWVYSVQGLAATGTTDATNVSVPLGYGAERLSNILMALTVTDPADADLNVAARAIVRSSYALSMSETSQVMLVVDGRSQSDHFIDSGAERAVALREALDLPELALAPGLHETTLAIGTADRTGQIVYKSVTGPISKLVGLMAPFGFDLRPLPYAPRTAQNTLQAGVQGVELKLIRPRQGANDPRANALTLHSWAQCARVLRIAQGPGGSGFAFKSEKMA